VNTFFRDASFASGQFVVVGGSYISRSGVILTSVDGEHWIVRRRGIKAVLQSVTYGGGQFVTVGDNGTILTSHDTEEWRSERSLVQELLASVAYGNGTFVAVGEQGLCISSRDGRHWCRRETGTRAFLSSISFDRAFFAHSSETTISSVNGEVWTDAVALVSK
jgi:photosystem II stability/assembly factor-like uncharacterized protein